MSIPTIKLNNGVEMPVIGYGVFQVSDEEAQRCVADAIAVGYRAIDTAQAYYNEEGVGRGIKDSGINRSELFITTKVWITNGGEEKAAASIDESLRKLQTDYIDLLLIHQHYNDYYGTWRAMEKALKAGKVRAIGLSNFEPGRFTDLTAYNDIVPAMLQLQTNVYCQQHEMQEFLKPYGTQMTAWSPLTQGDKDFFVDPVLTAIAQKYGKTIPHVALRYLIERGIVVIPKSTHRNRMEENFNVFDFSLTADDIAQINTLNKNDHGTVQFDDPTFIKWLADTYK